MLREGIFTPSGFGVVAAMVEIVGEEAQCGWGCRAKQPRGRRDWQDRKIRRGRGMAKVMVCCAVAMGGTGREGITVQL